MVHTYYKMCYYYSDPNVNCDACINVRVCNTATGIYLNFSILFDQSLLMGQTCELLLNSEFTVIITEQNCVELSASANYSIQCPICVHGDIHYVISNSIFADVEDCFDSGMPFMLYVYVVNCSYMAM